MSENEQKLKALIELASAYRIKYTDEAYRFMLRVTKSIPAEHIENAIGYLMLQPRDRFNVIPSINEICVVAQERKAQPPDYDRETWMTAYSRRFEDDVTPDYSEQPEHANELAESLGFTLPYKKDEDGYWRRQYSR